MAPDHPPDTPRAATEGSAIREFYVLEQLLTTSLNRVLRPVGLTVTSTSYLSHLERIGGRSSLTGLAEAMEATQSAVSKTTRTLEGLGFVDLVQLPEDGRRRDAILTEAGRAGLRNAEQRMHQVVGPMMADLTQNQVSDFAELLRGLADRIGA